MHLSFLLNLPNLVESGNSIYLRNEFLNRSVMRERGKPKLLPAETEI